MLPYRFCIVLFYVWGPGGLYSQAGFKGGFWGDGGLYLEGLIFGIFLYSHLGILVSKCLYGSNFNRKEIRIQKVTFRVSSLSFALTLQLSKCGLSRRQQMSHNKSLARPSCDFFLYISFSFSFSPNLRREVLAKRNNGTGYKTFILCGTQLSHWSWSGRTCFQNRGAIKWRRPLLACKCHRQKCNATMFEGIQSDHFSSFTEFVNLNFFS